MMNENVGGWFTGTPEAVLSHLGQTRGIRFDAGETLTFTRSLESVKAEIIEHEYPEIKWRKFLPEESGVDPYADTFVWYRYDHAGEAKFIESYAKDLPNVGEQGFKEIAPIRTLGISWSYDVIEIEKAAKAGYPLERRRGLIAREAVERKADTVMALGDTSRGITGFLNASGVNLMTQSSTVEIYGGWQDPATTSDKILADLHTMAEQVWVQSKQTHRADTMGLGTQAYKVIATRPYSSTIPDTILSVFLRSSPSIRLVEPWSALDLADAQGDGERAVVYEKNPMNMVGLFPLLFRSLPPQARSLEYWINAFARLGGCVIYRPLSMLYVDGMNDAHT